MTIQGLIYFQPALQVFFWVAFQTPLPIKCRDASRRVQLEASITCPRVHVASLGHQTCPHLNIFGKTWNIFSIGPHHIKRKWGHCSRTTPQTPAYKMDQWSVLNMVGYKLVLVQTCRQTFKHGKTGKSVGNTQQLGGDVAWSGLNTKSFYGKLKNFDRKTFFEMKSMILSPTFPQSCHPFFSWKFQH